MPSTTLRNAVDTYADSTKPSTTFGDNRKLALATGAAQAYLFFSTPVPAGAYVSDATLTLYRAGAWSGVTVVSAQRLSEKLNTSRLTWNNRPNVAGTVVAPNVPAGADAEPFTLDLTAIFQAVANGAAWYGLRLTVDKALRYVVASEGLSALRPVLSVTWSDAPSKPTRLSPTAAQNASAPKPVLRFQFNDSLGDTAIAAARVLVDDAADFVGAFDSGWVPVTEPEVDLSLLTTPAFPALAAGATAWWKVAARDGAGLEGPYSNPAQFGYRPLGTVTIANPAAGASPFVLEPTPPIVWVFSGGTQSRWQVFISSPADPTTPLKGGDSGQRTTPEIAWTVPAKVLTTPGPYMVTVRVWDAYPRVNDEWAEATRTFIVGEDPAVTGVSGLVATQPNPWPSVRLAWTRGTAPDSFVIARDGVVVDPELLPGESFVSGTAYRWNGTGGRVWRSHTFTVRAKVNGKQSAVASATFTPKSRGIWLLDEEQGLRVWLAGDDDGTFNEPEDATSFAPVGGKSVVRRVIGVRNYEGELAGQLVDAYGRTMRDYETDLRAMRDNPRRSVQLVVADYALDVILGDLQIYPTKHVPPSRLVSFSWWEV